MNINLQCTWLSVKLRLAFLRYRDGSIVIDALVDGTQQVRRQRFEEGEVFLRLTSFLALGRERGDRNALVAVKAALQSDGIVSALVDLGVLKPELRRTVPTVFGPCFVYELTDDAQALSAQHSELIDA